MILFLGTKPGKTTSKLLQNVVCPYCENKGTLTAVTGTTYFHLFWISLFRVGTPILPLAAPIAKEPIIRMNLRKKWNAVYQQYHIWTIDPSSMFIILNRNVIPKKYYAGQQ